MQSRFTQPKRYVFYDIESTSVFADSTQIVQIAMIETDGDLNILRDDSGKERSHMFYVKMRSDTIPDPRAFLVHKVDPEWVGSSTTAEDLSSKPDGDIYTEREASEIIKEIFTRTPNTCIAGYNNEKFDDEIIRFNFYRNFVDPYAHEWSNGNHRCDIFKLVQLCRMYSEKTLSWPIVNGDVSMKLEKLSVENGLVHEKAHDALSDIYATIFLAQLIKQKRPSLWSKFKTLSDKKHVERVVNSGEPLAMTQMYIPKAQYSTSLVIPVCQDFRNKNKYYCLDLTQDLEILGQLTGQELQYLIDTPKSRRKKQFSEINFSLRSISINKTPLVSIPLMKTEDESREVAIKRICSRIGHFPEVVLQNLDFVRNNYKELQNKIAGCLVVEKEYDTKPPYTALYEDFFSNDECRMRDALSSRDESGGWLLDKADLFEEVSKLKVSNETKVKNLLLCIYAKWGNYQGSWADINQDDTATMSELILYRDFALRNIQGVDGEKGYGLTLPKFNEIMRNYSEKKSELSHEDRDILKKLQKEVTHNLNRFSQLNKILSPEVVAQIKLEQLSEEKFSWALPLFHPEKVDPEQKAENHEFDNELSM